MSSSTDWVTLWRERPEKFHQFAENDLVIWASALEPGSKVLEVGCGNGANLYALQRLGMDPYGVEIANEALLASPWLLDGSQVKVGSAVELEFPDSSFDAVADVQCLQHLASDELPKAYSEVVRVLRPGGSFFEMVLVGGREYFPDLHFNSGAGSKPWLLGAGLTIVDHGRLERRRHGRSYSYLVLECEKA